MSEATAQTGARDAGFNVGGDHHWHDLSAGQVVIVIARWVLIATGLLITLWSPPEHNLTQVKLTLFVLMALAVGNFIIHSRLLMGQRVADEIVYAASAADVLVVTLVTWAFGGWGDSIFVFYYPALLTLSLVFPRPVTATFTAGLIVLYGVVAAPFLVTTTDQQIFLSRVLTFLAVAVIGQMYQHMERKRRDPSATREIEAKQDLFHGQVVIIFARWFLILNAVVLILWSATSIAAVTIPVLLMIGLMVMNFFLHGRYLTRKPANTALVSLSGAVDLIGIIAMVGAWTLGQGGGIHSPLYVLLFPALFAFGLVFPPRIALSYAGVTMAAYLGLVVIGSGIGDVDTQRTIVERLVTLGSAAGLGTYFWRIQRKRRREADLSRAAFLEEVREWRTA